MSLPHSLARLKRRINRPTSPLRRAFQRLGAPLTKVSSLIAPIIIGAGGGCRAKYNFIVRVDGSHPRHFQQIEWWQAIILGLVQGLTEFIPVSSSAHLNIAHRLMGHPRELNYDVMLSIGTVIALAYYYRLQWKALLFDPAKKKLRNLVLLSCVPAGIFGVIIHKFESHPPLSEVWFNAAMLAIAGLILLLADNFPASGVILKT